MTTHPFTMNATCSHLLGGILCCALTILAGCATSELVDRWSDPAFHEPPLRKILVISASQTPVQRRLWEDAFCTGLVHSDVAAIPSYQLFPDAAPDTDQVMQAVQSSGFDGVLLTSRLPSQTTAQYQEGYVTTESRLRYDPRRAHFVTYYREVQHAATVDSQTVHLRTIDVWSTKDDGRLIWSATSRTPEPASVQAVRPNIVDLVLSDLKQQGMLGPGR